MGENEKSYLALKNAFYVTVGAELLASFLFLLATFYVTKDWAKAEKEEQGISAKFMIG